MLIKVVQDQLLRLPVIRAPGRLSETSGNTAAYATVASRIDALVGHVDDLP